MSNQIIKIYKELENWISKNPKSYDLLDIKTQPIYLKIINLSQKSKLLKIATAPFIILAEKNPNLLRKFFKIKKKTYPQAQAIMARAYLAYYSATKDKNSLNKALSLLKYLEINTAEKNKFCWGQPYNWYSRKVIPAHTPRATVSTQVANSFLDAYEITKDENFLAIAIKSCNYFIDYFNRDEDKDGYICFSYTTIDNYHIHNANMLVASTLIRTWYHSGIKKFKKYGIMAMKFTISHQNIDGSWYYWAPPDKITGRIDNYHTGFILESFEVIRKYLKNEFNYDDVLDKGINYYQKNLFENSLIPKMTNKSTFPIDIQSCAQAIITFSELKNKRPDLGKVALKIAEWTIENMYDKKGYFYYRIYKNGKIDKTPYLRWAESWMLRALTFLIDNNENI